MCDYTTMPAASHAHPVDAANVERAQAALLAAADAERLSSLLGLLADPVRVRILFALVSVDELCVGDLALALDVSMDQSSYALKQLRTAGLVQSRRDGRVMYYRLADGFPQQLLDHCLRQLLTIANQESTS
jgi:ArsR family transcriptional regulator, lead/cadmium/zinc/bismuth-responsive transcriptional repressor